METQFAGEEEAQQLQQHQQATDSDEERKDTSTFSCCSCLCIPIPILTTFPPSISWISSLPFASHSPDGAAEEGVTGTMGSSTVVVPDTVPSPEEDCESLYKAFKGLGTDERALIRILGRRDAAQRAAILVTYRRLYNENLVQSLYSELSGDFRRAMMLWAMDPPERDARLVQENLKKKGDHHLWPLIEISCASSPQHLVAVRQVYCNLFHSSIEEDVASHFSLEQPFGQLLVGLVTSYRYCEEFVDEDLAKLEASILRDAISGKQLNHKEVIRVLATRNKSQLIATFDDYRQDNGSAFDEDIKNLSGNDKYLSFLRLAVRCLSSPEKHFAEVLRSSMVGLGTDEETLTRAIVTRAEVDMKKIQEEYKIRYKTSLESDVVGDTSGYYKEILLTLLGTPSK